MIKDYEVKKLKSFRCKHLIEDQNTITLLLHLNLNSYFHSLDIFSVGINPNFRKLIQVIFIILILCKEFK